MDIIKKTDKFVVIKNKNGTCIKLELEDLSDFILKLQILTFEQNVLKNQTVDGRKGHCIIQNIIEEKY
jgi:hypothetical protein